MSLVVYSSQIKTIVAFMKFVQSITFPPLAIHSFIHLASQNGYCMHMHASNHVPSAVACKLMHAGKQGVVGAHRRHS